MRVNIKNWLQITAFKAFKTFIQTAVAAISITGAGIAFVDVQTGLYLGLGAAISCFVMYFCKLEYEIVKGKFKLYAVIDEAKDNATIEATSEKLLENKDKIKESIEEKEQETKEDSSPSSSK